MRAPFVLCLVIDVFHAATFVCYIGGRLVRRRRGGITLQQQLPQALPGQALQGRRGGLDEGDTRVQVRRALPR